MTNGLNQYLGQIHSYIHLQEKRIRKLEQLTSQLQQEIGRLRERPPINVERIEYKFDQLKVETLEGTLNIGLNPSDLDGIEDFSVANGQVKAPMPQGDLFQQTIGIERTLDQYLEEKLPDTFRNAQEKLGFTVEDSYLDFIRQDIKKQLPDRIQLYLKEASVNRAGTGADDTEASVVERLKAEIENGVLTFLKQLPENVKGRKQ